MKTGLYTSPHLISPTERIRINFLPICEKRFAEEFFFVFDRITSDTSMPQPHSLQLLALLGLHIFIQDKVDVAIIETHHGGEFDITNVFEEPVVAVVTRVGMDHVRQLGPTIQDIAWHKSGIFRRNVPAISISQDDEIMAVLRSRAIQKGTILTLAPPYIGDLPSSLPEPQSENCAIAIAAVDAFVNQRYGTSVESDVIRVGTSSFSWPGRFEVVSRRGNVWFLDGAHNELGIDRCLKWFASTRR